MPFEDDHDKAKSYDSWRKVIIIITSILIPFLIFFYYCIVKGTRFVDLVTSIKTEQVKQTAILKSHSKKIDSISGRVTVIELRQKNQAVKKKR